MKKLTYEYVKEYIEKEGYELLSKTYENAHTKLKLRCPSGHEYNVTWSSFQQGHRKPHIGGIGLTYEYVKEQIEKEGHILLSNTYKNAHIKLNIQCPQGHKYKANWHSFQSGKRCSECSGNKKLTYEHIKEQFEVEGYKLLSREYKNCETKLKVLCSEGHEYDVIWNNFQQGCRCPVCSYNKKSSKPEKEILYYTKTIYNGDIVPNDRTQITNPLTGCNLELDIWLPELNKAIEFNGVYWHSFYDRKQKDVIKKQQCKELGIDLMVIHEEHWDFNKEKCLDKIQEFIKEN